MKKPLFYAAAIAVAFLLQNNLFAACPLIRTTPNLLLILTFVTAFIAGSRDGMLVGFFSGLLLDAFFGGNVGFYAMIYMAVGYVNGYGGKYFYRDFVTAPVLLCVLSDLAFGMMVYIFSFLLKGRLSFMHYFMSIILPETVYTAFITFIVYKPLLKLEERALESGKRSAKHFV
jgi:rod shape-determining protein MreD